MVRGRRTVGPPPHASLTARMGDAITRAANICRRRAARKSRRGDPSTGILPRNTLSPLLFPHPSVCFRALLRLLAAVALCVPATLHAQAGTGTIRGHVRDAKTGEPLTFCN